MYLNLKKQEDAEKIFKKMPTVVAVYYYGSRIKGYDTKDSDLDIAVIVQDPRDINYEDLYLQLTNLLTDVEVDLRIVTINSSPTYLFQILKSGKTIYQRSLQDRVKFETKVLQDFYDGEHLRRIYDLYLKQSFR